MMDIHLAGPFERDRNICAHHFHYNKVHRNARTKVYTYIHRYYYIEHIYELLMSSIYVYSVYR